MKLVNCVADVPTGPHYVIIEFVKYKTVEVSRDMWRTGKMFEEATIVASNYYVTESYDEWVEHIKGYEGRVFNKGSYVAFKVDALARVKSTLDIKIEIDNGNK